MKRLNLSWPIIHIIGLPGAGKTTLAKKLSKRLKIPIVRIGEYRAKFPVSALGEADAWIALFCDLSRRKWKNCIFESTGLNCRESFLEKALPLGQMTIIKLDAKRKILFARIKKKKLHERGGEWLFSEAYRDKYEFVKKSFKDFRRITADIKVNTSELTPQEVYKIVFGRLMDIKDIFVLEGE